MAREKVVSSGKCSLCGGVFDKSVMATHLRSCRKRQPVPEKSKKTAVFHLLVEGRYQPDYWMHLEIPANAMLDTLDRLLRDTWLECCGHMSEFEIQGTRFTVGPMDMDDEGMDVTLKDVLEPKMAFLYAYDFGSITNLKLKVISEYESDRTDKKVHILAGNEPPVIPCGLCGKPAMKICMKYSYSAE
ncbi:MAG TPA: hypothetical protein PLS24_06500, partial [Sedimentisphaerales bacterium]|nr:hypothetical protein [Sedimentisphaerales bacterium]